ncbi:uncharacterized protein LOC105280088 isoform X2 [Ooceraea biroi]|uniref:uncharacterized protein LOC105280088 isoform X2 n=1 Tax=Ooceraea biroi TaxID=2015173 RepID=UPI0005BC7BEA|nr:uncharacterized protein LOC105280088 isoform X2 [Ooceraea biroi]
MSLLLSPAEAVYRNDNKADNLFLSEDENEDYNFKRCREEEESVWASFVKQQELNGYDRNYIQPSVQSIKQLLDEGMREADKELKRLETDVLPDRIKKETGGKTGNDKRKKPKVNNVRDSTQKKAPTMKDTGTGSANLLLTIPEEENIPIHERRQEPEDFKSYARRSRSSHAITWKKQPVRQLRPTTTNGVECDSSPENSERRDSVIHVRPDPFTMHKILTMQRRVCELLDEIAFRLGNIPTPDGIKDLQRRQQCVAEFVVRFSRNYLYDLNRYVKDIQRHMYIISPRARIRPNHRSLGLHMHAIEHKLLAAHQLLLHALIAYCKHIPSSILKGHPGKFREILQVVIDLKTMCDRLHLNYLDSGDTDILSLGKDIEGKCNAILSKLKLHMDNELDNKTSSMASFTPHSANNKKRVNRKQLSNRLSMYSMGAKVPKNNPRSKINNYQKDKKYNAIDIRKVSNESILDQPYPSPVTPSRDQVDIKKHRTYAKEEDIKTVMDTLPIDSDNGSNPDSQERHYSAMLTRRIPKTSRKSSDKLQHAKSSETIEDIVKNTCTNNDDNSMKNVTTITEEHLSNLIPIIADLMSFVSNNKQSDPAAKTISTTTAKQLMEFLQKYQSPKSTAISASTSRDVCHSSTESSYECEHLKTDRTLIGTQKSGENMRLICVSSIENAPRMPRCCDASCQADCERLTGLPDFEMKMKERNRIADAMDNIELVVSDEIEMNFLQYKREYQRLMQSIPMYSSNTQNKPWDIVAWISDKLVDELITEIAKELQIDDVIRKLFELEFQEF